jgi:hypothetical protein
MEWTLTHNVTKLRKFTTFLSTYCNKTAKKSFLHEKTGWKKKVVHQW